MPYAPDKARINGNSAAGMDAAIAAEHKSLNELGAEIIAGGWAPETADLRDAMQKECTLYHAAQDRYYQFLRRMVKSFAAHIDSKDVPAATQAQLVP